LNEFQTIRFYESCLELRRPRAKFGFLRRHPNQIACAKPFGLFFLCSESVNPVTHVHSMFTVQRQLGHAVAPAGNPKAELRVSDAHDWACRANVWQGLAEPMETGT
jgi:hypothetical protein